MSHLESPVTDGSYGPAPYAATVTTDGGASWHTYDTVSAALTFPNAVSCATTSVCWAAGSSASGAPAVAETTDGGQTWTNMTPATWPASWMLWSIDCTSAT